MGKDPAHRKYNIPDEPLFVDMDGLKFTFFEEDIIRSRPAVDDPDDAAVQWSPTEWSVSVKILQLVKADGNPAWAGDRSEEHTSELQSLMRISYAVFFLKK